MPDALERAAELDAAYGSNPDLEKMPMYGVVFSFKDPFDTKDMRSTGGGDAHYDIDFPARDHVLVEQLRKKGGIIFAKAVNTEYNGRAGDPGGRDSSRRGVASGCRGLAKEALLWIERESGPNGPTTARTWNNRALLYHARGRYAEAEPLFKRALGLSEKALGPDHPDVALVLTNLATLYDDQGQIGRAHV